MISKVLYLSVFVALASACSIHSSQLDALQNIVNGNPDPLQTYAWRARWNGNEYLLYAVSAPDETIFAFDKEIYVHFDGWNITKTEGILPYDGSARIDRESGVLVYYLNERLLSRHACADWREQTNSSGASGYFQNCEGRESYRNLINVDSSGSISRLEFVIHPEYPPLTLLPLTSDIK